MSSPKEGQEREAAKSRHPSVNWYPDLERMARRLMERHAGAREGPPEHHDEASTEAGPQSEPRAADGADL